MPSSPEKPALVFFDIDGTLLNDQKQIPASAVEAIRTLQKNGHLAFLNTGRAYSVIQPHILAPGFDGIIAGCGTWIQFRGETLLNATIDPELIERLMRTFRDSEVDAWFEGPSHVYVEDRSPGREMDEFLAYFEDLPDTLAEWSDRPIIANKLSYMLHQRSRFEACLPLLEEHFYVIRHMPIHGEIVPKGYSKATGIRFFMDLLNIPRDRTYAFGDSLNDIDMLTFAGQGIAMAGSRRRVLSISDHVTAAPDDHGIAEGLRHFGLI